MVTKQFSIFKDIKGNRQISDAHVRRLMEAIKRKNLLKYIPILCNEHMEVIDGQHRLKAAINLNIDIHYEVIPGLRMEDVVSLNTNSKSWSLNDFIDSWITLGKHDYVTLRTFTSKYGLNPSVAAMILSKYSVQRGGSKATTDIKRGEFKVESLERGEMLAEQLMRLRKFTDEFDVSKDRELILALRKLNLNETFDFEQLIAKLKLGNQKITKRPSEKYYILQIEELYNFKAKIKQELYRSTYEYTKTKPF